MIPVQGGWGELEINTMNMKSNLLTPANPLVPNPLFTVKHWATKMMHSGISRTISSPDKEIIKLGQSRPMTGIPPYWIVGLGYDSGGYILGCSSRVEGSTRMNKKRDVTHRVTVPG